MHKTRKATDADTVIGNNIRRTRMAKGMSQEALGAKTGVTFQQIQKYEKGTNRVAASKILVLAKVLGCDVMDLFAGTELPEGAVAPAHSREATKLAMMFDRLPNDRVRSALLRLASSLIDSDQIQIAA